MPATVVLDLVQDARIDIDLTRTSVERTGYIKNIDTSGVPATIFARATALPDLPVKGSSHPYYTTSLLTRYQFVTKPGVNNKVWFKLIYETPQFRNPSGDSLFTLERHRRLENVTTEKHPKNWADITVSWKSPTNANFSRPTHPIGLAYRQPLLVLVATGYIVGSPPAEYESAYRMVNKTTWHGYPKGYWMYMGADDKTEDFGNSYSVRLEFETKVTEDWSSYGRFVDHTTGLGLKIADADALALKNRAYAYDVTNKNGAVKAGLYDLAEFNDIFAF